MCCLAHQNRTIAMASDFRVDGAKSPELPQKEGVLGSEIAARNRKSLATFHRTLKSQCSNCFLLSRKSLRFLGVRDGHRNRKSQKSLRFRCAEIFGYKGLGKNTPKTMCCFLPLEEKSIMKTVCQWKSYRAIGSTLELGEGTWGRGGGGVGPAWMAL